MTLTPLEPPGLVPVLPRDAVKAVLQPETDPTRGLDPGERVLGLAVGGEARAYPLRYLQHHQIVNDVLGGRAVAAVHCPLSSLTCAFDRDARGRPLTFKVSGMLYKNALVAYDEETGSLWVPFTAECVQGPLLGSTLTMHDAGLATWGEWRAAHPGTSLLRAPAPLPYDDPRWADYAQNRRTPFPVTHGDERLHPKTLVAGIRWRSEAVAVEARALAEAEDGEMRLPDVGGDDVILRLEGAAPLARTVRGKKVPVRLAYWFAWVDFHASTRLVARRGGAGAGGP